MKKIALLLAAGLTGCVAVPNPPPQRVYLPAPQPAYPHQPAYTSQPVYTSPEYAPPVQENVVSIVEEAPIVQPEPVMIDWAPPPMLVEAPPPSPFIDAIWVGGYWVWRGDWVWAHGHWAAAPRPGCTWIHPYYEHRGGSVIFIDGFWAMPGVIFVPPPPRAYIRVAVVNPGVIIGVRPIGPEGVFVPPPPGSRHGLIIPAPIGTPPAVVIGAPPVIHEGMHIQINNTVVQHNTTIINNVTVVAPPSATVNGRSFSSIIPAQAHLAAQQTPIVHAYAPPVSPRPASVPQMPSMTPVPQPHPYAQPSPLPAPTPAPIAPPHPVLHEQPVPQYHQEIAPVQPYQQRQDNNSYNAPRYEPRYEQRHAPVQAPQMPSMTPVPQPHPQVQPSAPLIAPTPAQQRPVMSEPVQNRPDTVPQRIERPQSVPVQRMEQRIEQRLPENNWQRPAEARPNTAGVPVQEIRREAPRQGGDSRHSERTEKPQREREER